MKILYTRGCFRRIRYGNSLLMMRVDGVLTTWWKLASIFSGGMLGLFLLAF